MRAKPKRIFNAVLRKGRGAGGGVFVLIPYDVGQEYGKKNLIPVNATFDGKPYRGSIANLGRGPCLIVVKAIREAIGKGPGDSIAVTVELDTAVRRVRLPADARSILARHPAEKTVFAKLSYSQQRELAAWIDQAKKPETRASRVEKMLNLLRQKRK
jgi:hypothetical protein